MKQASLYVLSQIFTIAAIAGLIWQIVTISCLYFSYDVRTRLMVAIPDFIATESVSFCSRYTDIIDFEALNKETGRSWSYSLSHDLIRKYQDELSIAQLFKYTPKEDTIISKILFRNNDSYIGQEAIGDTVVKDFSVEKYLYLEYMCYKVSYQQDFIMPYTYFAVTPYSPGLVYEFFVNKSSLLYRSNYMKILITSSSATSYPFRSISMSGTINRYWNESTKTPRYNRFKNFKMRITTSLLPTPYATNCFNYTHTAYSSDAECMQVCLRHKTVKEFGKLPFSVIINSSYSNSAKQLISYKDVTNDTFMERLLKIQEECRDSLCGKISCSYGIALTETKVIIEPDFRVSLDVPSRAWIYVRAEERLKLVEFVTYVMGIIGTFTGFSIMSFDPVKCAKYTMRRLHRMRAFIAKTGSVRVRAEHGVSAPPFPRTDGGMWAHRRSHHQHHHHHHRNRHRCRSFM
jgi:hypothetical protein